MGVIHRRSRSAGAGWDGVEPQAYDDPSLAGVRKHELIGEAEGAREYRMHTHVSPAHRPPPAGPDQRSGPSRWGGLTRTVRGRAPRIFEITTAWPLGRV
jgi:hypothetical protein